MKEVNQTNMKKSTNIRPALGRPLIMLEQCLLDNVRRMSPFSFVAFCNVQTFQANCLLNNMVLEGGNELMIALILRLIITCPVDF